MTLRTILAMNNSEPAQTVAPIAAPMPQPEAPPASTLATAPAPAPSSPVSGVAPHSLTEDAFALFSATLLIALDVAIYGHDHLLTGGMAGLAFIVHYASGISFGKVFFVLKTIAAVALLSLLAEWTPHWIRFAQLDPIYASVLGGVLLGVGFLMLFRHRASLGGVGILAFYLQESRGWKAGHIQMAIDCAILLLALWTAPLPNVALSVAGAVVLNLILTMSHRKDRYIGS